MVFRLAIEPAVAARDDVVLCAVASRSGASGPGWADVAVDDYDDVLDACDAVYVPLPNDLHLPWVARAAAAGVHVLCEKPLATDPAAARAAFAACDAAGVLLAEAWMTPFHPVGEVVRRTIAEGAVGELLRVDTTFTFTIGPADADNYRWSAAHGGGALLDLGIYTLSPLLELLDEPELVSATTRRRGDVDATFHALVRGRGGAIGTATGSFEAPERQRLEVTGTTGRITVDRPFTADEATDHLVLETADGTTRVAVPDARDPYAAMLGAFAAAVRGDAPWPRSPDEVLRLADLVAAVRGAAATG
jgi:predicted dehydrogenase